MVSEKKYAKKNINIHTESRVRYDDVDSDDDDTQTCARLCASKKSFIVIHHDRDDGIKYNLVYSVVSAYTDRLILPQYLSSNTAAVVVSRCCSAVCPKEELLFRSEELEKEQRKAKVK